jgi:ferredoxin
MTNLESYLAKFSEADWLAAIDELSPAIHEVDRNATQIWFRFYPLSLARFVGEAEDKEETRRALAMQGDFGLEDKIDSSHSFLYGHRFWKAIKAAIEAESVTFEGDEIALTEEISQISGMIAEKIKADPSWLLGITAIGMMTLNQVGLDAFKAADGVSEKPMGIMGKSPDAIVADRAKDDSQGVFGFLKTVNKKYSVRYQDALASGRFEIINEEDIASASARDQSKDWKMRDERCWEGVVPVECRSASCGTCWVGVLGGQDNLSEVRRLERRAMKIFGYNQPDDPKPYLRLACQSKSIGNVTIVIPPWNAVFGKKVYGNVEDLELEPVTTSAKALRDTIASAASGE